MSFFNNINWSPQNYFAADVIGHEGRAGILERLAWVTLTPNVILDVGCGTGELSVALQERYPQALVWGVDSSQLMLEKAQENNSHIICTDAATLPFKNDSVDMVIANLLIPWHDNHEALLKEWRRVLRPDGMLMFTLFGPDTLIECRSHVKNEEIPLLIDMHDFGDLLLHAGFTDPVLDVDYFTLNYQSHEKMLQELIATGMWFPQEKFALEMNAKQITYELVYGHAFVANKTAAVAASQDGIVRVPLAHLRKQLQK